MNKMSPQASLVGARTGWFVEVSNRFHANSSDVSTNRPVRARCGGFATFSSWARPPRLDQGGEFRVVPPVSSVGKGQLNQGGVIYPSMRRAHFRATWS